MAFAGIEAGVRHQPEVFEERAFARARRTDDEDHLPLGNAEVLEVEDGVTVLVPQHHVPDVDQGLHRISR